MGTPLLSILLLYFFSIIEFFLSHCLYYSYTYCSAFSSFFCFLPVATRTSPFLEVGKWSRMFGHLLQVVM
ncbi:hypothetical protein L208DRAFT_917647 [Tricholoma matsutake]|nr:hypothetical protein L208DRAFT_917647 [Tricholoma matsutake 945]